MRSRVIHGTPTHVNELQSDTTGPKQARVEIIPLIDVIFFLLATFVLFTLTLHRVRVLEADLPPAGHESGPDENTAFIQASGEGRFYWKIGRDSAAEAITASELGPRLANYKRSVLVPRVLVRSDDMAKFGAAALVLDEVRRAKIKQVAIETKPTPTGS
jgi:biopolymer transport protein ExbD